jgi:hypothetical protein
MIVQIMSLTGSSDLSEFQLPVGILSTGYRSLVTVSPKPEDG